MGGTGLGEVDIGLGEVDTGLGEVDTGLELDSTGLEGAVAGLAAGMEEAEEAGLDHCVLGWCCARSLCTRLVLG